MELTLPEELLLIALHDEKGYSNQTALEAGLGAGVLLELARAEAIAVEDDKVVATGGPAPDDPVLRAALELIGEEDKPRKPDHWVTRFESKLKPFKGRIADGLVERGVLTEERSKFLGLIPHTRYPEADPAPERQLRERLHAVLVQQAEPTEKEALLVGILEPLDLVNEVVPKEDRKAAKHRAKAIKESGIAGNAVRDAVQAIQMMILTTVIIPSSITASTS